MRVPLSSILITILLSGCTVGPGYRTPPIQTPRTFRAPEPLPLSQAASFADLKWFEVFQDEKLQELIRTALKSNYDLRQAVARIDEARANLGIAHSEQFPNFAAGAGLDINRLSRDGATPLPPQVLPSQNRNFGLATLQLLSFEIDIWGRLRRASEAAQANLSADATRKAVITTVVGDVVTAYLTLRELDYALDVSRQTLANCEQSLELTRSRKLGGVGTLLDLRQAEQLVYSASETIPVIEQQIEETENRIHLLLGENPGAIARRRSLTEQNLPPNVPPGIPSAVASGISRHRSRSLTAGRLKSQVQFARETAPVTVYEKTIQTAFSEASDALIAHYRVQQSREQQEMLVSVLRDRLRLAYLRYRGWADTQLNALDADRDLFQAELELSQLRLQELLTVVQLYKALGGGWRE